MIFISWALRIFFHQYLPKSNAKTSKFHTYDKLANFIKKFSR